METAVPLLSHMVLAHEQYATREVIPDAPITGFMYYPVRDKRKRIISMTDQVDIYIHIVICAWLYVRVFHKDRASHEKSVGTDRRHIVFSEPNHIIGMVFDNLSCECVSVKHIRKPVGFPQIPYDRIT